MKDRVSDVDAAGGKTTVLMVVGAGRGPLVRASLRASERSGRPLRVYAVEKNPNAVITLQSLVEAEGWSDLVTVISSDMRSVDPPEPADVLVSELLGSFGDNELSPECLDGAQRFLKPGGVSIPQAYTSYLAPVTCAKLWNDAKAYGDLAHMETPYVVKLHRCALIADPAEVFTFEHPNEDKVIDNSRYAKLRWRRTKRITRRPCTASRGISTRNCTLGPPVTCTAAYTRPRTRWARAASPCSAGSQSTSRCDIRCTYPRGATSRRTCGGASVLRRFGTSGGRRRRTWGRCITSTAGRTGSGCE